jgi:hypothetical protein
MRRFSRFLLGAAGIAALAGAAYAADREAHVLKVMLPDGSVEQIHYTGDVAPRVVLVPAARAMPVAFVDPFAEMERAFAEMDARADAMLRQAAMMQAAAPAAGAQLDTAALKTLPPGTVSYSFTSYSSGDGKACSQSVQVTALEAGKAPKVVRQDSGDCTAMNSRQATPAVQQTAPAPRPAPIPAAFHPADAPKKADPSI